MSYKIKRVAMIAELLKKRAKKDGTAVLKSVELKALFDEIKTLPANQRSAFGAEVNQLKQELESLVSNLKPTTSNLKPIDVTAPWDVNSQPPQLLSTEQGSKHPIMAELELMLDIYNRMGFDVVESRQLDDDWHMFGSLNFPEEHPARDDYDTFVTVEKDKKGRPLVAPAHTSTMQNRVLKKYKSNLEKGQPIAVVIPGRVFRNEDLDARHEHTFHQLEGVYVGTKVTVGHLIATLKTFLQEYYQQELDVKTQPFYFPFTEPSFEFALSCPFCSTAVTNLDAVQGGKEERGNRTNGTVSERLTPADAAMRQEPARVSGSAGKPGEAVRVGGAKGCNVCSYTGWIELLGCGMIHPNVLKDAGIDPNKYTGFAWGMGIERPVMIKHGIEDIRHFEAGKLDFLRQFS